MDYFSMKRKELQALCKEHNIPANSANSVLADKLSQLLNEKEKPITRKRACLKSSVETTNEDEPAVSKREVKKVRFSPNNDVREYQMRSGKKHVATPIAKKTRRKSVATEVDKLVVDNDSTNEIIDDSVQIPDKRSSSRALGRGAVRDVVKETSVVKEPEGNLGKVTRSKANLLAKGDVVQSEESKQSKKPVKDVKKGSGSVEETVVGRVRVTRSKAQAVTDDSVGLDVNPQAKKKRGGQVAKDVPNVELSDELMEIPARVTRSRQNSKEDVNNVVSNPKAEKKRTRREMKATDQSSSLNNVTSEGKQELPERKSLRTRGVENMDEDQGDKKEVVNGGRATRAKAQLAVKSGSDGKSRAEKKVVVPIEPKMVQKPEESIKKVGRKNVNQRKSVMPSKNSKVAIHPEEPVNHRTRNTRSTSVMPEAQEKVNEEPEVVRSPAVEKKQAKGKYVDVTKSGKVASALKTAVNATGSPKSRKRRGTPVTEDQGIGTNYGAVFDESARRSTRSAGESEGNSAANKQAPSVKTPTSGIGKQSAAKGELSEGSQIGTRRALRSGATTRGDSSNKRAKLSVPKQNDAEYSAVKSSKKGTPFSKLLNFEPGEKVVETELTPAIDGSRSQITRSAIRSDKTAGSLKKPSQTSIKKQPIGDAQISTHKAAKFRPDPAVNTAPGRVTRSGIKDGGNASSYYAEKVEKKKPSRSAHQVQPLDDAQISVPEVEEASLNPDVDTLGVQSDVYNEAMGVFSENTVDLSKSEIRLPTKVVEENIVSASETAIVVESIGTVLGEKSSEAEPHSISNGSDTEARDVEEGMEAADASIEKSSIQLTPNVVEPERGATPCLTENLLSETQQKPLDLPSAGDESLLVPNLSETPFRSLSQVEVQIAVNSEKLDVNEMDSAETGFVSTGQQTDVMVEEQVVSIETTVVMEGNAGVSLGDAENDSFEQPDAISTKEVERPVEPSNIENGSEQGAEDESASAPTSLMTKLVSEDNNDTLDQATDDDKLQGLYSAENDIKDGMDAAHGSLTEPTVLPVEENLTPHDVADVSADAGNEPAKELESDVVQSPDVMSTKEVEMSVEPSNIENGSEQGAEDERASAATPLTVVMEGNAGVSLGDAENDSFEQPDAISTKEVERPAEPSNIENGSEQGAEDESASAPTSLMTKLVSEDNNDTLDQATDDDKLQGLYSAENDIKDGMDAAHGSLMEPTVLPVEENLTPDDVADVSADAGNEPAKELESDVVQSPDVMSTKEVEMSVEPSNIENGSEQGAEDERASAATPLTTKLVSEDNDDTLDQATDDDKLQGLYLAENDIKDGMDAAHGSLMEPTVLPAEENLTSEPAMQLESDAVQSTGTDVHRSPILGRSDNENDSPRFGKPDDESDSPVLGKFDGEDANVNTGKECETDEGLNSEHFLQDPVSSDGDGHGDDEVASTLNEQESNPKPDNKNDVSDTSLGKNDDFNMNKQPEPTPESSSFNDITETPCSYYDISVEDQKAHSKPYVNDVLGAPVIGEDDVLVDAGNEPTKELESDAVPSIDSDVPIMGTSVSRKFDGEDANVNEFETDEGVNSNKEHMLQETASSGDEDDDVNTNDEHESNQTLATGNDDDFSMTKQPESISEPSSSDDIKETPFSGSDIPQEARDSYLKPLTGNDLIPIPVIPEDGVTDDTISVPKEHETGLEPSNDYETLEGHVSGNDVENEYVVDHQSDEQDGESERDKLASNDSPGTDVADSEYVVDDQSDEQDGESERNKLAINDSPGTDEQYVGGYDLEPENNANMPAETEILISASHQESVPESNIARGKVTCYSAGVSDSVRPSDLPMSTEAPPTPATSGDEVASVTVDVLEESLPNINKDVVANIFGDIYGLGSTEVTDIKNDGGNEQMTMGTSENIEGVSKESESVYPCMSDEQITEETNTTEEINHASTSDQCLDGGSNLGVDELDTELVEDLEAYEYPTGEGSPSIVFTQEFSASLTSSKENDRNKQGETRETDTCQGLGDYSFGMDEQKPISENESHVLEESQKDNQVSDIDTSARASFFKEGSSSSAAGLVDSVKSFDKVSGHMIDGKSTQADVMREKSNPIMNEEIFNWTGAGSSMRSLFTTSPAGQIQYEKDGQDDEINFVDQDQYSSQESLFTMSATTTNSYAKGGQEGPVDIANINHYSSMTSLYSTTPSTATISHAKCSQEGPVDFADLNHYSSMKSLFSTTPQNATISHVKGAQEDQVEYSNQYHYSSVESLFTTPATATVSHLQGGQDYAISSAFPDNRCNQGEDSTDKLYEDEVDGSSDGSGKNHFEFRSHRFDFLAGSAGTGHHEASGLKESSIDGGSFKKETESQLKRPKTGDDNSF